MKLNGAEVSAIEYRPGEGLVVRVGQMTEKAAGELRSGLDKVLRGSGFRLLRDCCDGDPDGSHQDGCADRTTEEHP